MSEANAYIDYESAYCAVVESLCVPSPARTTRIRGALSRGGRGGWASRVSASGVRYGSIASYANSYRRRHARSGLWKGLFAGCLDANAFLAGRRNCERRCTRGHRRRQVTGRACRRAGVSGEKELPEENGNAIALRVYLCETASPKGDTSA